MSQLTLELGNLALFNKSVNYHDNEWCLIMSCQVQLICTKIKSGMTRQDENLQHIPTDFEKKKIRHLQ